MLNDLENQENLCKKFYQKSYLPMKKWAEIHKDNSNLIKLFDDMIKFHPNFYQILLKNNNISVNEIFENTFLDEVTNTHYKNEDRIFLQNLKNYQNIEKEFFELCNILRDDSFYKKSAQEIKNHIEKYENMRKQYQDAKTKIDGKRTNEKHILQEFFLKLDESKKLELLDGMAKLYLL